MLEAHVHRVRADLAWVNRVAMKLDYVRKSDRSIISAPAARIRRVHQLLERRRGLPVEVDLVIQNAQRVCNGLLRTERSQWNGNLR